MLVGAVLLGAAGALVAVPFAAMLQVLFDEVFVPWRLAQIEGQESTMMAPHGYDPVSGPALGGR